MARSARSRSSRGEKTLRPVHANAGIEAAYRKRLYTMVEEMNDSVLYWLKASYRKQEPRIVGDESPAAALRRSIRELSKRWLKKFDAMAAKLAEYFAQDVEKRSTATLKKILKDGGWTVEFQITPAIRDIMQATVEANVALIKSIPRQYLTEVEGIVYRGVQNGQDLGLIAKDLEKRLGVTKRRAAFIARDQSSKATAAFVRARHLEAGIEEAVWMHSSAGKEPRPTHLKAGREKTRYKIAEGWYDPHEGRHVQPGELINCRCTSKPVVPGFR